MMRQRRVQSYLGESKLYSLGFVRDGQKFVLKHDEYDQQTHRIKQRIVGWIKLDSRGYVLQSHGFRQSINGDLQLYQRF